MHIWFNPKRSDQYDHLKTTNSHANIYLSVKHSIYQVLVNQSGRKIRLYLMHQQIKGLKSVISWITTAYNTPTNHNYNV